MHDSRLPLFPHDENKGPFIADQQMQWFQPNEGVRPLEVLDPVRFREARRELEDHGRSTTDKLPSGGHWEKVYGRKDRAAFLAGKSKYNSPNFRRLVLMIEAGIGKTTAVQQVVYLRNCALKGHLAIGVNFSQLPIHTSDYLDAGVEPWLCQQLKNLKELAGVSVTHLMRLLRRKISEGRFSIVVDSFDQVRRSSKFEIAARIRGLNAFINRYPNVSVVCAGRPNSILDAATDLFDIGDWTFVQIGEFDHAQQKRYLGEDKIKSLEMLEVELLSQPRMGEAIRRLPIEKLRDLRTASSIHWAVLQHVNSKAFKDQGSPLSESKYLRLASAIAFQLLEDENFDGVTEDGFEEFMARLLSNRGTALNTFYKTEDSLWEGFDNLARLNEGLDFALMEDGWHRQIYFRNRTLQAFLAALWCTRFSSEPNEKTFIEQHLYVYGRLDRDADSSEGIHNSEYYEFCRLLCEMPNGVRKDDYYLNAIEFLYKPLDRSENAGDNHLNEIVGDNGNEPEPKRSTEMMYRSWWQLIEISTNARIIRERQILDFALQSQASIVASDNIRKNRRNGNLATKQRAIAMIEAHLLEFRSICDGRVGTLEQQELAREVDREITPGIKGHGFLQIPRGHYWYGSNKVEKRHQDDEFLLSKFPVTNEVIRLFDPAYGLNSIQFKSYREHSSEPSCPAICVDYFTAFCCSLWLGSELPNEFQWERGCRGQQEQPDGSLGMPTRYYTGESHEDLILAGFTYVGDGAHSRPLRDEDGKVPNNFGLKHMHGSVNELTVSWFENMGDEELDKEMIGSSRVARGGAFSDGHGANSCNSCRRKNVEPRDQSLTSGFRLLRRIQKPSSESRYSQSE